MKIKIYLSILCISSILLSYTCGDSNTQIELSQNKGQGITVSITPGNLPHTFKLDSIVESARYVQLELTGESAIAQINRISIFESYILILEYRNNLALLFDVDGNAIGKLGRIGKGPGEFLGITSAQFNPYIKTIDILTNAPRKIIRYDWENLKLRDEISLPDGPYLSAFYPQENNYLVSIDLYDPAHDDFAYHFLELDAKTGNIQNKFLPMKQFERVKTSSLFLLKKAFYPQKTSISAYYWGSPAIYKFEDGNFSQKYFFNFKKYPFVTNRLLKDRKEREDLKYASEETCCLNPLFETPNFITGSYFFGEGWGEHFVYSKASQKLVQYSDESIVNNFNGLYFRAHHSYYGDEVVFAVSPGSLLSSFESNKDNLLPKERKKLENFLPTIDPEGNQVLVFYKIKDF